MTIASSEINWYRSTTVNDTSSNGGRLSTTKEVSGLTNSLWPDVAEAERLSGSTKYRKTFIKIDNASDAALQTVKIGLLAPTPGDDIVTLFPGTNTDIQSGISTPNLYGAGTLDSPASASASTIDVLVEDGAVIIFRNGNTIRIADKETAGEPDINGTGNEEFHVINGTPTILGDVVTITLTGTLANSYSTNATVSSLIEVANIVASVTGKSVTSTSGTFDETKMTAHAIGGLYQIWTFTFSSSTAFSCSGDVVGSVGTGNINSTFAPNNTAFSTPYFTVLSSAWGGTFANGDTVQITTLPASTPIWEKRYIPAGAGAIAAQMREVMVFGESA